MNRGRNILSLSTIQKIMFRFLIIVLLFGCKKIELERIVMVATGSVTNVSYASCSVQGTIIDKGEKGIDQHGFCWAVTQNPTTANNKTQLGPKSSTGNFSGNLTGLSANTTYYVRAYAQNKDGVFYGNQKSFSTLAARLPTVTTTSIRNITENSAQSGGTLFDGGGAAIIALGVCWSTSQNPTIFDNHTTDPISGGADPGLNLWFLSSITGLSPGTSYYVRAYATNSVGTGYGGEVNFTTTGQAIVSPMVTTSSASDITETSATIGGNVTADGGATVIERGVYYSTSASPETTGTKLQIGSGTGTFSTSLTGLSAGITYYIKAYATNSVGTAYGDEVNFTTEQTIVSPTVTTSSASDIAETSATVSGNVTNDGGATVTERGVYYSTSASPETTGTKLKIGSDTGTFSTSLTGLSAGTTYYIKAYATNSIGTSYGSEETFTTLTTPSLTTTAISAITENSAQSGGNITDNGGALVTVRGVCWSTSSNPTTADSKTTDGSGTGSFTSSLTGLSSETTYYVRAYATNSIGTAYGNEVNFTTEQTIVSPTVTTSSASDITETSATVGGNVTADGGTTVTERGVYYSTSASPETTGTKLQIGSGTGIFSTSLTGLSAGTTYYIKAYATNSIGTSYGSEETFTTFTTPSLTTTAISAVTENSAQSGGNVTDDGGASVTARGVCWSTSQNPTITNDHTTDGSGTGSFISSITGLTQNTAYYVRAYATNSVGTAYGDEITIITSTATVTDYEGNVYQTITIGSQEWMRENLKSTKYADGIAIPLVESATAWDALNYTTDKAYCYYDNSSANRDTYGALYIWVAAMNGANSSVANPSGVQGVCPDGWHLPSDDEWKELEMYLGMTQAQADAGWFRGTDEGGKLKETGTTHWNSPNTGATNENGFSALPGGVRHESGTFDNLGYGTGFWSATEFSSGYSWNRYLNKDYAQVDRSYYYKGTGWTVRCLRD